MVKVFIATLGFEEKWIIRMLTRHGIERGDKLIILTYRRIDRVENAIKAITDFIGKYYKGEVELSIHEIPVHDLHRALEEIVRIIRGVSGVPVVVNISGGMRALILELILALTIVKPENCIIEIESEDTTFTLKLPFTKVINLSVIGSYLTEARKRILTILDSTPNLTAEELSRRLGVKVSTVRKHLDILEKLGLVSREGKPYRFKVTDLARVYLQ